MAKPKKLPKGTPQVGEKIYHVCEHRYYVKGYPSPLFEYFVCEATMTGYRFGGYIELVAHGKSPDGYMTPYYLKLSDLDSRWVFRTESGAAKFAKQLTEEYERVWGWLGAPSIPLRRPWESQLNEKEN